MEVYSPTWHGLYLHVVKPMTKGLSSELQRYIPFLVDNHPSMPNQWGTANLVHWGFASHQVVKAPAFVFGENFGQVQSRMKMHRALVSHGRNPVAYPQHTNQHEQTRSFHLFQIPIPFQPLPDRLSSCGHWDCCPGTEGVAEMGQVPREFKLEVQRLTSTMHDCGSWSGHPPLLQSHSCSSISDADDRTKLEPNFCWFLGYLTRLTSTLCQASVREICRLRCQTLCNQICRSKYMNRYQKIYSHNIC